MRHILVKFVSPIILAIALSACGGGGGGGGSSAGGNSGTGTLLTVSASSLDFTANRGETAPEDQSFTVRWTDPSVAGFVIGTPPGESVPTWLDVTTAGRTSPVTVTVGVNNTNLDVGTYSMTLRIVTGDANANPLRTVDVPVTYTVSDDFRVSETALQTERVAGSTRQIGGPNFEVRGENVSWTASADQPWVSLNPASGTSPQEVSLQLDSAALPIGANLATITIQDDADPQNTLTVDLTVDVRAPQIDVFRPSLVFSGTNGAFLFDQDVRLTIENEQPVTWTATPSEPWIVTQIFGSTGRDTMEVSIDAETANLASGTYNGEIVVSTTYAGAMISETIPVELTLTPATVNVLTPSLDFQGALPTDFVAQDLEFLLSVPREFPWQVDFSYDDGSDWLQASPGSGMTSGIDSTGINVASAGLTEDSYTGTVNLTVNVNADVITASVPVTVTLEPHRLSVVDNGVALVDAPGISKLSHSVTVSDNRVISVPWTASSDQAWLSVTPSGTTGGELVLTADPAGLAPETIHYATVTIESTAPSITNSGEETIRVGFYVTAIAPIAEASADVFEAWMATTGLVADPIRPYVYVTDGLTDISVYNVYSGALVDTISNAGGSLRFMTVSTDGSTLYALDHADNSIVTVDLDANPLTANAPWTDPAWDCNCSLDRIEVDLHYTRINGQEVLIGADKDIIDANTGVSLYRTSFSSFLEFDQPMAISGNGGVLFRKAGSITRKVLKYSELDSEFDIVDTVTGGGIVGRDVYTDDAGDLVYRECHYPTNDIAINDGLTLDVISTIPESGNGGAILGPDGLVYCARYEQDNLAPPGIPDAWVIDPATRTIITEYTVPQSISPRRFTISGDGQRIIMRSNRQRTLWFQSTP